jgi:hypothetical protein
MKTSFKSIFTRAGVAVAAAAVVIAAPASSLAMGTPGYATPGGEQIRGTIKGFDGAYTMYVRDTRGYVDTISLHKGTVITPTGIQLQPGFQVTVSGHPAGDTFAADEIDTPYHAYTYRYPYAPYPYLYPYPYPAFYGRFGWVWR